VFLSDACEAESSCDRVYSIAESPQLHTRHDVLWQAAPAVVDASLELDVATTARLLQKHSEAETTVSRQLPGVKHDVEEFGGVAREALAMDYTCELR
jgi:hypothetical protein